METYQLLKELCDLAAPSGRERSAAETLTRLLDGRFDRMETDPLGNLLVEKRAARADAPTLLLDAHMDEVSFAVTGEKEGFLTFLNLGGVDPRILMANEVLVHGRETVPGVVTCMPPHLSTAEERKKAPAVKELCIDVGLPQERVRELLPPGSAVTLRAELHELSGGRVAGKSLDNRAGAAAVLLAYLNVWERIRNYNLKLLFSVQEEVGLRGARTGVAAAEPEECVVVDVTHAYTSDARREETGMMGEGVMIGIAPILDRGMFETFRALAQKQRIPHQIEVMNGSTGTNAFSIHNYGTGVRTGLLSIPLKYMHTSVELIDRRDLRSTVDLLSAYLLEREGVFGRV